MICKISYYLGARFGARSCKILLQGCCLILIMRYTYALNGKGLKKLEARMCLTKDMSLTTGCVLQPESMVRIMEGKYQGSKEGSREFEEAARMNADGELWHFEKFLRQCLFLATESFTCTFYLIMS